MNIRRYKTGEEETLWHLCRDTTLLINGQDYGMELVKKWVTRRFDMEKWKKRIQVKNPFVAEQGGIILGFAELTNDGHIDAFYSHHQRQR